MASNDASCFARNSRKLDVSMPPVLSPAKALVLSLLAHCWAGQHGKHPTAMARLSARAGRTAGRRRCAAIGGTFIAALALALGWPCLRPFVGQQLYLCQQRQCLSYAAPPGTGPTRRCRPGGRSCCGRAVLPAAGALDEEPAAAGGMVSVRHVQPAAVDGARPGDEQPRGRLPARPAPGAAASGSWRWCRARISTVPRIRPRGDRPPRRAGRAVLCPSRHAARARLACRPGGT